jgi:hypothetical protein
MSIFCGDGCLTGMTTYEQTKLKNRIRRFLGEPVLQVELQDEQIEENICIAIETYSSEVNNWVLFNRLPEMLGLPSDIDFTLKYISNSLYFEKAQVTAYGEQVGGGVNSQRELKRDSIVLTAGTQDYTIPAGREVNEVLWFTPSFVNITGLDPFNTDVLAVTEFHGSYLGNSMISVLPVFNTLLTAQAAELRNRVRGNEYSYILRGGADGTKVLKLFPVPYPNNANAGSGFGVIGTPGTMFYTYYDSTAYGNIQYSGNSANPGFTGYTSGQTNLGFQGNGLVSSPADAQLNYISYNQLNSVAQTWVKRYALALCKETLGMNIRGKFKGTLPIPGAELSMNSDDLASRGIDEQEKLLESLRTQLNELSYDKLMERRASIQENINKNLGYGPLGIDVF